MKRFRILFAFFLLSFAVSIPSAQAISLTVQPATVRMSAAVGTSWHGEIILMNAGEGPVTVSVGTLNFTPPVREGGLAAPLAGESTDERDASLAGWIRHPHEVELETGQQVRVPVTISVPDYAAAGMHFGAVTFTPSGAEAGTATTLAAGIALNVVGQDGHALELKSFSLRRLLTRFPAVFSVRLRNAGDTIAVVAGNLVIENVIGGGKADVPLPYDGENRYLMPASARDYTLSLGEGSWGLYRATLTVAAGAETTQISRYFAVFPWPFVAVSVGVIVLAVVGTAASSRIIRSRLSTGTRRGSV